MFEKQSPVNLCCSPMPLGSQLSPAQIDWWHVRDRILRSRPTHQSRAEVSSARCMYRGLVDFAPVVCNRRSATGRIAAKQSAAGDRNCGDQFACRSDSWVSSDANRSSGKEMFFLAGDRRSVLAALCSFCCVERGIRATWLVSIRRQSVSPLARRMEGSDLGSLRGRNPVGDADRWIRVPQRESKS